MSASKGKQPTDFNDLHNLQGLDAVREQVLAALEKAKQGPVQSDESVPPEYDASYFAPTDDSYDAISPHPSGEEEFTAKFELSVLLKRFALAMPDAKVWDSHKKVLLKTSAFRAMVTKRLADEWLEHNDRRTVEQSRVLQEAEQEKANTVWGPLGAALDRYVYLYPSTDVWDRKKSKVVPTNALKLAIADCYDDWVKHPCRVQIDIENLVFDPTQSVDPATHINMFTGLPVKPVKNELKCHAIRELVFFLCNKDPEVYMWLISWLAYPLQNVGGKMATAVMMHSEMQGSGKSLFFEGIMRKIYGTEYSATLGQHQLESPYTDWRSKMLYGLFEEIFSRDQKYSHTGTVKLMITGETQRIEKKFMSGWEEANHMNAVFLSNEIQPFPVEPFDRRMLVIWPEGKLPEDLKNRVVVEMNGEGVTAFYYHLLNFDLHGFDAHTQPPMTEAKERLIDFGRPGWDLFYREWERGVLSVPFSSCLLADLYEVYKKWCGEDNERVLSKNRLCQFLISRPLLKRKADANYNLGTSVKKGTFLVIGKAPEDIKQGAWLGKSVEVFRKAMEASD